MPQPTGITRTSSDKDRCVSKVSSTWSLKLNCKLFESESFSKSHFRTVALSKDPHLPLWNLCIVKAWARGSWTWAWQAAFFALALHAWKNLVCAKRKWCRCWWRSRRRSLAGNIPFCVLRWPCVTPVSHCDSDSYANYRCVLLLSCHCVWL